jgi:hypothetical protein
MTSKVETPTEIRPFTVDIPEEELRQAGDRGGQLVHITQRPFSIENHGIAAIGAHRNCRTVRGCSAPAFDAGPVESQSDGSEHRRSDGISL